MRKKDGHGDLVVRLSSGGKEGGLGTPSGCRFRWPFYPLLLRKSLRTEIKEDWTVFQIYFLVACSFEPPTPGHLYVAVCIPGDAAEKTEKLNRDWECLWIKIVPASTEGLLPASIGLVTFCCPEGRWDSPQAFLQNIFFLPCLVESQAPTRLPPLPSQPLPCSHHELSKWLHWTIWMTWPNWFSRVLLTSPSPL